MTLPGRALLPCPAATRRYPLAAIFGGPTCTACPSAMRCCAMVIARAAVNALRIYRANFDRTLHDPQLAPPATTTEAPAVRPMLVLAGADDGCIPPAMFADARRGLAAGSRVEVVPDAGRG
jgi:pimeloyl-ACP methyl ester carboxylesterase